MEKKITECVFAVFFFILLQLSGIMHQSISPGGYRNSPAIILKGSGEEGHAAVAEMRSASFCNLSLVLLDSPINSFIGMSGSSGLDKFLVLPNTSKPIEPDFRWGIRYRFRRTSAEIFEDDAILKKPLRIAIIMKSDSKQSMKLEQTLVQEHINKFTLHVFEAAVKLVHYKLSYEKVPFNASQYDVLKAVAHKSFDAAVGDIIISAKGYEFVEFSQPFVDPELAMVVTTKANKLLPWFFASIFTPGMWFLLAVTSFFNGFVIWLVEHQNHNDDGGSPASDAATGSHAGRIAIAFSFAFATLCYGQRERPRNSLSHVVLAPWLLLMLVVSATFTSSFMSMITCSPVEPSKTDIDMLKRTNAVIGCDENPVVIQYLVKVLGFKPNNIRGIASTDDYAEALSSGNIKAAFVLMPYAKIFLAKYCTGFAISGPTYELGGFGFVFPKGSTLASDMSEAIVRLRESGKLQLLKEEMLSSFNCKASPPDANMNQSLGHEPFLGLFIISGGASTLAFVITVIRLLRQQYWERMANIRAGLMGRGLWTWLATLFAQNRNGLQLTR